MVFVKHIVQEMVCTQYVEWETTVGTLTKDDDNDDDDDDDDDCGLIENIC